MADRCITHYVEQGSAEWHALRARHFTASDAPAMMGVSPYYTRGALLRSKASGLTQEPDQAAQRRFDDGHAAEAACRPMAEAILADQGIAMPELFPAVLSTEIDGLPLLASLF
ncbi:MAG: hypothetical protein N2690_02290 [Rhodocyclaceae bacterium]|nr:hypothetical protein [Rhodocyclaceae bacterium]